MSLDSYNSQYPAAYYELGTAYSFYTHDLNKGETISANNAYVTSYAKGLKKAVAENPTLINGSGQWGAFHRAVGVVVDKNVGASENIVVLFQDEKGEYSIRKFVVSGADVFFNDKEYVNPAETLGGAANDTKAATNNAKTGPIVETVTGPVAKMENKKTGPVVEKKTGPVVQ